MKCPKCKSANTHVDKKGFSGKQAAAGALIAGPLGAAAGIINSNKIKITCLDCGYSYSAGNYGKEVERLKLKEEKLSDGAGVFIFLFMALLTLLIWWIFDSLFFGIMSIIFACISGICLILNLLKAKPKNNSKARSKKETHYNKIFSQLNADE